MTANSDASEPPEFGLQIFITAGPSAVVPATIGLATAVSAAASGEEVVVFLTGEGAYWASADHGDVAQAPGFEPVETYMTLLAECGGRIEGCGSCLSNYRDPALPLRDEIIEAGLSIAAIRMTRCRTVVF